MEWEGGELEGGDHSPWDAEKSCGKEQRRVGGWGDASHNILPGPRDVSHGWMHEKPISSFPFLPRFKCQS